MIAATWWTWQQACAWVVWRDLTMVARVAPRDEGNGDAETVESLLAAQRAALRRSWRPTLQTLHPLTPDPAAGFPPIRGSIEEFQYPINVGLLRPNDDHLFDAEEVRRNFPMLPASSGRRWLPIAHAIQILSERRECSANLAWEALKEAIRDGELPAQGIDDLGDTSLVEPHWFAYLSELNDKESPPGRYLWFDRRTAAENRLARNMSRDNRAERSMPPGHVRKLAVNASRFNELYPPADTGLDSAMAIAPEASDEDRRRRRGPEPGTLKRYRESDRELFPEIERIMRVDKVSATAAAKNLADEGRVEGTGTLASRARRLVAAYHAQRGKSHN